MRVIFGVLRSKYTAQKIKFCIKDFFSKCDQICSFLRIWSHFLKKSLMENFIFVQWCLFKIKFYKCFWIDKMRNRKRSLKINLWIKYLPKTTRKLLNFVIRTWTIKTSHKESLYCLLGDLNETSWHGYDTHNVNVFCSYSHR